MIKAALLGLAALLAAGPSATSPEVRSAFVGADPLAIFADVRMWIYATGDGERLASRSSIDGVHWQNHGDLIRQKEIRRIGDDRADRHYLWAPDMLAANGRYYLYYSVGPQGPTPSRLGVTVCSSPQGPCVDSGRPLLTGGNGFGAIDPMVFVDRRSGRRLLHAGGSARAKLRVFELGADMTTITREVAIEQPPLFTEGVFMHERRGIYYLSWSHGRWNAADYSVH